MNYLFQRFEPKLQHKKLGELIMKKHSATFNIGKIAKFMLAITIATTAIGPNTAWAQELIQPPTVQAVDSNGVNVATGEFVKPELNISIGNNESGLSRIASEGSDNFTNTIRVFFQPYISGGGPLLANVSYSGQVYQFIVGGGNSGNPSSVTMTPGPYKQVDGSATLTCSGNYTSYSYPNWNPTGSCELITADGTKVNYDLNFISGNGHAIGTSIIKPDGETVSINHYINGSVASSIKTVSSTLGWILKYSADGNSIAAVNSANTYCDINATSCPNAPTESPKVEAVTNASGRVLYRNGQVYSSSNQVGYDTTYITTNTKVVNKTNSVNSVNINGSIWQYQYTVNPPNEATGSKLATVTNPNGTIRKVLTNQKGISRITDELGRITKYNYDVSQFTHPTKIISVAESTTITSFTYDARLNVTSKTIKPNNDSATITESATYSSSCDASNYKYCNKPLSYTDQAGVTTIYTYDPSHGGILSVTSPAVDGKQAQTRYGYSQITPLIKGPSGNMVAQPPVWRLTSTSRCMTQNLASCVGTADERKTVITYSQTNVLPITTTTMLGDGTLPQTSTFTYDYSGRVIATDGPENYGGNPNVDKTYTFYDTLGRSIGSIGSDPDGAGPRPRPVSKTVYDIDGRVSEQIGGFTSGIDLSALNAMSQVEKVAYEYDTITGLAKVTRAYANEPSGWVLKNVSQTSYDNMMRVDCVAQRLNPAAFGSLPASACTIGTQGADGPDQITKNVYDNGNAVTSAYSAYGTPSQITAFTKTFNTASRTLATITDAKGNKTSYTYDNFNRPIKTCYPSAANGSVSSTTDCEQISYNGSRLYTTTTRDGQYRTYYYDPKGRVSAIGSAKTQWFYYNNFDELFVHYNQHDASTNYYTATYRNALGWVTNVGNVTDGGTLTRWTTYYYDAYGRRAHMYYPDGYLLSYQYNDGGELIGLLENNTTPIYGFAYDILGRSQQTGRGNGVNTTYGFDSQSRLNALTHTTMNTTSFTHGTTNQIKSRANSNTAFDFNGNPANDNATHNGLNQIATRGGANLSYDGRGNLISDGTSSYTYNIDNQLLTATKGGITSTFDYDAENRLYSITKNGTTTKYVYDGLDLIMEYDGAGNVLRRYVHGGGMDEPLLWYEGAGTSDKRYLHADNQGNIIGTTNASAAVLNTSSYDPYGNRQNSNAAYASRFGYTGQIELPDVELKYYKARFYTPVLGRFLQSDPIRYQAGMNLYGYVLGDPVNFNDPLGLQEAPQKVEKVVVTGQRIRCPENAVCLRGYMSLPDGINSSGLYWRPGLPARHDYAFTEAVCDIGTSVSLSEMQKSMSKFSTPRGNDFSPLSNGDRSYIVAPVPLGWVNTTISPDGLTVVNLTNSSPSLEVGKFHLMCCGTVERRAFMSRGKWYVSTRGQGYNMWPPLAAANQQFGPGAFEALNTAMKKDFMSKGKPC